MLHGYNIEVCCYKVSVCWHTKPILMFLTIKMVSIIERSLVTAFQYRRLLLVRTDSMTPVRFAGRKLQNANTVRADGPVQQIRRRMRNASGGSAGAAAAVAADTHAPFRLASELVAEERTRQEQVVCFAVTSIDILWRLRRFRRRCRYLHRRRGSQLRFQFCVRFHACRPVKRKHQRSVSNVLNLQLFIDLSKIPMAQNQPTKL